MTGMSIDLKRLPSGAVLLIALIAPGILAQQADRFLLSAMALRARLWFPRSARRDARQK